MQVQQHRARALALNSPGSEGMPSRSAASVMLMPRSASTANAAASPAALSLVPAPAESGCAPPDRLDGAASRLLRNVWSCRQMQAIAANCHGPDPLCKFGTLAWQLRIEVRFTDRVQTKTFRNGSLVSTTDDSPHCPESLTCILALEGHMQGGGQTEVKQLTVSASRRLLSDAPASMRLPSDADCFKPSVPSAAMPARSAGLSTAPLPADFMRQVY